MGDGTGDEDGIVVGTRDGDLSCCRSGGAAVDVSDGVGEGGSGVLSCGSAERSKAWIW